LGVYWSWTNFNYLKTSGHYYKLEFNLKNTRPSGCKSFILSIDYFNNKSNGKKTLSHDGRPISLTHTRLGHFPIVEEAVALYNCFFSFP
jgi:hypothetical protein